MSVALLWPAALLALAAWALPLILHLQRREMRRITPFSALRWLSGPAQAQRSVRIERPWLLLLRLLLLGLFALLLAQPVLRGDWRRAQDWVLVVPGVDTAAARQALPASDATWRWLVPGFPKFDISGSIPAWPVPARDTASLLRELDTDLPQGATLSVMAPSQLPGLDGQRLALSRPVRWTVVVDAPIPPVGAATPAPRVQVAVRHDAASSGALRYVRAAVRAWNALDADRYVLDIQTADHPVDMRSHWLLWLGAPPPPGIDAWIAQGGVAVVPAGESPASPVLWRDGSGQVLAHAQPVGKGRRIELTMPWVPARSPLLLDARFADDLLALFRERPRAPDRAATTNVQARSDAARATPADAPLDAPLALLIALLFVLERIVATRRSRSPA